MAGECGGGKEMLATHLDLQPGVCINIVGDIPPDAKDFRIELGKDLANIGLHFNPRFKYAKDTKIIAYNSRNDYIWGNEVKVKKFPFVPGSTAEINITFEGKQFKLKLPDGSEYTFPNRLNLESINFLGITHDFNLRSLSFQ
ncbi:galectin-1-like [Trichosurus vulpecula]|uniref:galectin-1-like n=1 Tax=Trichosurus vulpecula TaxID=9337 RepID=UPI00186AC652|nr:galectin-1-like [Trichosurus vulpecula]